MNIVSSNSFNDGIIISCGNSDDGRIKVWNIIERQIIFQFPDPAVHIPFYNLNLVALKGRQHTKDTKNVQKSSSQGIQTPSLGINADQLVFVTSGRDVSMYEISITGGVTISGPIECEAEIGTYLSSTYLTKVAERHFRLMVANILGDIEFFDCILDSQDISPALHPMLNQPLHNKTQEKIDDYEKAYNRSRQTPKAPIRRLSEKITSHNSRSSDSYMKQGLQNNLKTPDFRKMRGNTTNECDTKGITQYLIRKSPELTNKKLSGDNSKMDSEAQVSYPRLSPPTRSEIPSMLADRQKTNSNTKQSIFD